MSKKNRVFRCLGGGLVAFGLLYGWGVEALPTSQPAVRTAVRAASTQPASTRPVARRAMPARQKPLVRQTKPTARRAVLSARVSFLFDKLKQHHWRARYDATQALAKMGWKAMGTDAAAVEKRLVHHLRKDQNFWVRQGAARALGALGQRAVLSLVAAMTSDPKSQVRNSATKALAAMAARGRKPLLGGHLSAVLAGLRKAHKDKAIRWTAGRTWELLTGDPKPIVAVMIDDLKVRNSRVKGIVAQGFARLSPRAKVHAANALIAAIAAAPASTSTLFFESALTSIGALAVPSLRRAKTHQKTVVRAAVSRVLNRIPMPRK